MTASVRRTKKETFSCGPPIKTTKHESYCLAAVLCSAGLALFAYWPGLTGFFILDDFPTLSRLGDHADARNLDRLVHFVLGGSAGPLGRPVSLASFLIDGFGWPASPWHFKKTNVLIHLLTGVCGYWAFYVIYKAIYRQHQVTAAVTGKFLAAATLTWCLWLLHPFNVSTVLYVVQRMTQLSALFVLLGIVGFIKARTSLTQGHYWQFGFWTALYGLSFVLGTLAKENAALLCLYTLLTEYWLLRPLAPHYGNHKIWDVWLAVFAWTPAILILAYLAYKLPAFTDYYAARHFDLLERLLTECRILWHYLYQIIAPQRAGSGLFFDRYEVSTGLLTPVSTLVSAAGVMAAVFLAWQCRRRFPIVAFSIGWFLAGHSLESTVVPLELYFEHRNYLPMIGPLFGVSYLLYSEFFNINRFVRKGLAVTWVILFAFITVTGSLLWGNHAVLAKTWHEENPDSLRATQLLAAVYIRQGDYRNAIDIFTRPANSGKDSLVSLSFGIQTLLLYCHAKEPVPEALIPRLYENATTLVPDAASTSELKKLADTVLQDSCADTDIDTVQEITARLLRNPGIRPGTSSKRNLYFMNAEIAAHKGDFNMLIESLKSAFAEVPDLAVAHDLVDFLSREGYHQEAVYYFNAAQELIDKKLFASNIERQQLKKIEAMLNTRKP